MTLATCSYLSRSNLLTQNKITGYSFHWQNEHVLTTCDIEGKLTFRDRRLCNWNSVSTSLEYQVEFPAGPTLLRINSALSFFLMRLTTTPALFRGQGHHTACRDLSYPPGMELLPLPLPAVEAAQSTTGPPGKPDSVLLAFSKYTSKRWDDYKGILLISRPNMCINIPLDMWRGYNYCN